MEYSGIRGEVQVRFDNCKSYYEKQTQTVGSTPELSSDLRKLMDY